MQCSSLVTPPVPEILHFYSSCLPQCTATDKAFTFNLLVPVRQQFVSIQKWGFIFLSLSFTAYFFPSKRNPIFPTSTFSRHYKTKEFFSLWPDFANLQVLLFKSAAWLAWGNSFGNGLTWKSKNAIWLPLWHSTRHTVCGQLELALQERSCRTGTCGPLASFLFFKKKHFWELWVLSSGSRRPRHEQPY